MPFPTAAIFTIDWLTPPEQAVPPWPFARSKPHDSMDYSILSAIFPAPQKNKAPHRQNEALFYAASYYILLFLNENAALAVLHVFLGRQRKIFARRKEALSDVANQFPPAEGPSPCLPSLGTRAVLSSAFFQNQFLSSITNSLILRPYSARIPSFRWFPISLRSQGSFCTSSISTFRYSM